MADEDIIQMGECLKSTNQDQLDEKATSETGLLSSERFKADAIHMEECLKNSNHEQLDEIRSSETASLNSDHFKAKRAVSFKDQLSNQSLHTVHLVVSLKEYNAKKEKRFCPFRCDLL